MKTPDTIAQECAEAFLRWPLPESVHSDLCATMKGPNRCGTHLINYDEAEQMAREVMLPLIAAHDPHAAQQSTTGGGLFTETVKMCSLSVSFLPSIISPGRFKSGMGPITLD